MANFFDEVNVCEHQYTGRINQLNDESLFLEDETRSSVPLLVNADEPATFCVKCQSLPSSSSYLTGHVTELRNPVEWSDRLCNGHHDPVLNNSVSSQYLLSPDGADMPLLSVGVSLSVVKCSKI